MAGFPFIDTLVGPSAMAWGRQPGDAGRVAYLLTDGGTAQPPDGVSRTAKVLRVEPAADHLIRGSNEGYIETCMDESGPPCWGAAL